MGMQIQQFGLNEDDFCGYGGGCGCGCYFLILGEYLQQGNNDLLILIQFVVIEEIYYCYVKVGVDIVEMNMFFLIIIVQVDYGFEVVVYDLNFYGVWLVWQVLDCVIVEDGCLCWVVGVLGLINCMVLISLDVNNFGYCVVIFDDLCVVYVEQICGLIDGGVDLILIEMIFDMLNVKVVIFVCEEVFVCNNLWLLVMILGMIIDLLGCMLLG